MKKGWQTKNLGDLCEIELGETPARANSAYWDEKRETGNVWLSIADLLSAEDKIVVDSKEYVSDKGAEICKLVPKGTLLVSFKLTLGRLAFAGRDVFTNEAIAALTIFNEHELSKEFLFYCLCFFDWVKAAENDVKLKGMTLNKAKLKVMPVFFPLFPEQQRIVGILDEAFAGIATAKANAEKNLQNARALFESHVNAVLTQRGERWVEKTFDDVCDKITDGTHHSPQTQFSERAPGTFPYITSKNIRNNFMDLSKMAYVERAFHDEVYSRCKPSLGDVLLTKDGANTGNVTLNTIDEPFSLLSSVCLIKTNQAVLKPAFLCFYLQSSTGLSAILGQMTGAAIKRIVLKDIKKAVIPFPPLKEQETIVATLNSLLAETQRLASIYQRKLATLEALRKSLLHQAFSGEL